MIWNPEAETLRGGRPRGPAAASGCAQTVAWAVERVPVLPRAPRRRRGCERLDDLAALPFTRKTDLREHYPFGLFAVPTSELARVHASSGTKGKPTVVGYTAGDLDVWREVMARVMVAAGARPRRHAARRLRLRALHRRARLPRRRRAHRHDGGAGLVGQHRPPPPAAAGLPARPGSAARPRSCCTSPRACAEQGGDPRDARPALRHVRRRAVDGRACGRRSSAPSAASAYDIYGLSEIIGPGVAGECEARDGLHVCDDHFLPEIVDPATGAAAAARAARASWC